MSGRHPLAWLLLLGLLCSSTCTASGEKQAAPGYDIQLYRSPDAYQALYIEDGDRAFGLVSEGERRSGALSATEHGRLLRLLEPDSLEAYGAAPAAPTYPSLVIRRRAGPGETARGAYTFGLDPRPPEGGLDQLLAQVEELLERYGP